MAETVQNQHRIIKTMREERDRDQSFCPLPPLEPQRTLLLLGPTRAGKSTIVNVLKDSLYETPKPQLYSATRSPSRTKVGGLRIIDMPGFFDQQTHGSSFALSNKNIIKMLREVIEQNGPIDIVAFVFHLAHGIKNEDIETMILIKQEFSKSMQNMLLVVTHAEELDETLRSEMIDDFFQHPKVIEAKLKLFFNDEILFLGCLRYESLKQNNEYCLRMEHENVLAMRRKFLDKCIKYAANTKNTENNGRFIDSQKYRCVICTSPYIFIIIILLIDLAILAITLWLNARPGCLPMEPKHNGSLTDQYAHHNDPDRSSVTGHSGLLPFNISSSETSDPSEELFENELPTSTKPSSIVSNSQSTSQQKKDVEKIADPIRNTPRNEQDSHQATTSDESQSKSPIYSSEFAGLEPKQNDNIKEKREVDQNHTTSSPFSSLQHLH